MTKYAKCGIVACCVVFSASAIGMPMALAVGPEPVPPKPIPVPYPGRPFPRPTIAPAPTPAPVPPPAASPMPVQPKATLSIKLHPNDQTPAAYFVTVEGQTRLPGPYYVAITLYGDDPSWDDDLEFKICDKLSGPNYKCVLMTTSTKLNEDWGGDEIYALVTVKNTVSGQMERLRTNVVTGSW